MSVALDNKSSTVIITRSGQYVLIDTCWTLDHGYETMVFECDPNGRVTSWSDLDVAWYHSKEEADIGHANMINKWLKK